MATKKVTVTRELIERATQRDSRHCMVAEAIKSAYPRLTNISVDLQTIRYTDPRMKKRYTCLTPPLAGNAIVEFDQGRTVEPFKLSLIPVHVTAARVAGKKTGRGGSHKPRVHATDRGQIVVEGGPSLPRGHLGGNADVKSADRNGQLETTAEGNVLLSSGRYRQYGLRQLRA